MVIDVQDLPPLNALRVFAAAARRANFTRTAEDLGITQGAVSHQIRVLEDQLGLRLFHRQPRKTLLTHDGRHLAEALERAFGEIGAAIQRVKRAQDSNLLIVNALPGFAVKWLFPRLIRFDERHPEIDVQIHTNAQLPEFAAGEAHISLRYGLDDYPGLVAERLLDDEMFPVCSPALRDGEPPLHRPEDLRRHTLLHDDIPHIGGRRPGWRDWLRRAGLEGLDPEAGRRFGQSNITLQAAIEGRGVALGRSALVDIDLAQGSLVEPFGPRLQTGYGHFIVYPRELAENPRVQAFRAWLHEEAGLAN